ncbi:hypothetical protein G5I_00933 [Acromyrmex echinatior]|uniref:Uncharacterized protein n=1 Tax=Acromyrmex echinatior TaxID=103372 RepID=F4W640_ACREC|nr:hypothetical protein G5I_00933 [Acromyrmex echinatior]
MVSMGTTRTVVVVVVIPMVEEEEEEAAKEKMEEKGEESVASQKSRWSDREIGFAKDGLPQTWKIRRSQRKILVFLQSLSLNVRIFVDERVSYTSRGQTGHRIQRWCLVEARRRYQAIRGAPGKMMGGIEHMRRIGTEQSEEVCRIKLNVLELIRSVLQVMGSSFINTFTRSLAIIYACVIDISIASVEAQWKTRVAKQPGERKVSQRFILDNLLGFLFFYVCFVLALLTSVLRLFFFSNRTILKPGNWSSRTAIGAAVDNFQNMLNDGSCTEARRITAQFDRQNAYIECLYRVCLRRCLHTCVCRGADEAVQSSVLKRCPDHEAHIREDTSK